MARNSIPRDIQNPRIFHEICAGSFAAMKLRLQKAVLLAGFVALSASARQSKPDPSSLAPVPPPSTPEDGAGIPRKPDTKPSEPPDRDKVSYALGMRLGLQ